MLRLTVAPSAARRGATPLFSWRASRVCSSGTAIQRVKESLVEAQKTM
jgi:hypothetical protein